MFTILLFEYEKYPLGFLPYLYFQVFVTVSRSENSTNLQVPTNANADVSGFFEFPFLTFVWATRVGSFRLGDLDGIGADYKDALTEPGTWLAGMYMQGETIPKEKSTVSLDSKKDDWGMPLLKINMDYDDNDEKMIKDFFAQLIK